MSKTYYTRGDDIDRLNPRTVDEDDQIPSVKYVKDAIKSLVDDLNDKIEQLSASINYPIPTLDVISKNAQNEDEGDASSGKVKAEDVITDARRRFVTQAQLDSFKDKPTMQELNMVLSGLSDEIQQRVDTAYVNIMNTPNALQKLKDLALMLRDNADIRAIAELSANKVDKDEFVAHKESVVHMTSNDRKALNILIKTVNDSFADWNATEDDVNFIKNKPSAMPADGGDAHTLDGRGTAEFLRETTYDSMIGYDADRCNLSVDPETKNLSSIFEYSESMYKGCVFIKSGYYRLPHDITIVSAMPNVPGSMILAGNYTSTIIEGEPTKITLANGVILKDLFFRNCNIIVKDNVDLNHIYFKNCTVEFSACQKSNMMHCTFEDSIFKYNKICQNNMVMFNRGNAAMFDYRGGNNVVIGNQSY